MHKRFIGIIFGSLLMAMTIPLIAEAQITTKPGQYVFPVIGNTTFRNDFYSSRSNGRHNAIDIMANKHLRIVSATDGMVTYAPYPQPSWGWMVRIKSDSNYEYNYIHLNNDTPGTDDGRGGAMRAYAPDIKPGMRVVKGQLIGWVGDSGNAENTGSHLHFEVVDNRGRHYNPYTKLTQAVRIRGEVKSFPTHSGEFLPFGRYGTENANLAMEDMNGDGISDYIVGAGYGSKPWVKVFSGSDQKKLLDFYPFGGSGNRGADVAAGDINGDGKPELIVGSRTSTGGRVGAYSLTTTGGAQELADQVVYGSSVNDVRVAAGDIDGDGKADVIAGAGAGGGPRVKVLDILTGQEKKSFYPFDSSFRGGVDVTAGNLTGDSKKEIVSAALSSGSSLVYVHDEGLQLVDSFKTYASSHSQGVRIDAANINQRTGYDELASMPNNSIAQLKYFDNVGNRLHLSYPYEEWWIGNYDVAADDGGLKVVAGGNRRTSVR